MTYSVVARDPASGMLGVAVQSCMFAAGAVVPWLVPGVGAVASQAIMGPAYGPLCLDAVAAGATPAEAIAKATAADPASALRQIGVVSAEGAVAAFTGPGCVDHAGHLRGEQFTVQANMAASPQVWPAMAAAYRAAASEPFARRLLAALQAAQEAGGDARGVMAAAIVVVGAQPADPGQGRLVDIRVDHSDDPLGELACLLDAADAYACFARGVDALFAGDSVAALAAADAGLALLPDDENLRYLRAGALIAGGELTAGADVIRRLVAARPSWAGIVRSFAARGLIRLPEGTTVDTLLA